ncbi:MAG: SLC13 family permease [Acidobacteriaceae bacterium]
MPVFLAHSLLPLIVALSILLMLLRPWGVSEVWWVSGGAVLLVGLGLVPLGLAGRAVAEGSDVYLFLVGMMLLAELAREQGVFDWVASVVVRGAGGSCSRLFFLVYAVGTVVTVFLSNDATAVVLTPAILVVVRKARISPLPYLFVCALVANAASFVLPISNPANLVVFHAGMPPLGAWLRAFGVPSVLAVAATYWVMWVFFRGELCTRIEGEPEPVSLSRTGRLVLWGLGLVVCTLLVASAMRMNLGLPTCLAALVVVGVVSLLAKRSPVGLFRGVSWGTILLVAGLFVMVDAVESQGALRLTEGWLAAAQRLAPAAGVMVVGFAVGVANNVVNNLPLGLIAGATLHAAHVRGMMADVVMVGVDLGPNLSVTGSLATILWLLALRKEGVEVGFWRFFKLGVVAMPVALAVALGGVWVMGRV